MVYIPGMYHFLVFVFQAFLTTTVGDFQNTPVALKVTFSIIF